MLSAYKQPNNIKDFGLIRYYVDFVMCRYLLHLQIAQHVVIALNLLSLAAIVMFGNIVLAAELWMIGIVFLTLL